MDFLTGVFWVHAPKQECFELIDKIPDAVWSQLQFSKNGIMYKLPICTFSYDDITIVIITKTEMCHFKKTKPHFRAIKPKHEQSILHP
jgi:hypothetical protein